MLTIFRAIGQLSVLRNPCLSIYSADPILVLAGTSIAAFAKTNDMKSILIFASIAGIASAIAIYFVTESNKR